MQWQAAIMKQTRRGVAAAGVGIVALLAAAGCGAPAPQQAQAPPPAAVEDIGAVQDAFDTDETTGVAAPRTKEELEAARKAYSPFAGKTYPRLALFGDTHLHTANSGDAFMGGNRLTPEQAYRFARGEEVVSSTGVPVRLSRPLDFVVTGMSCGRNGSGW